MDQEPADEQSGPSVWLLAGALTWVTLVILGIVIQQLVAPTNGAWGLWEILGHVVGFLAAVGVALRLYRRDARKP